MYVAMLDKWVDVICCCDFRDTSISILFNTVRLDIFIDTCQEYINLKESVKQRLLQHCGITVR